MHFAVCRLLVRLSIEPPQLMIPLINITHSFLKRNALGPKERISKLRLLKTNRSLATSLISASIALSVSGVFAEDVSPDRRFAYTRPSLTQPVGELELEDRMALRRGLDNFRRDMDQSGVLQAMDSFNQNAYQMLTSAKVRDAFDLTMESPRVRERNGMHAYGQRGLMARRLVEAGCRFVEIV